MSQPYPALVESAAGRRVDTSQPLGELVLLATRTGQLWWRSAPVLLAALIFNWAGYYLSLLIATEVAPHAAWVVIPCLAAGVVIQLLTIIWALRHVVSGVSPTASLGQTLAQTLLPFLALVSAFGFVSDFAAQLSSLFDLRWGLYATVNDIARVLDPFSSRGALIAMSAVLVVLNLVRRWLEYQVDRAESENPARDLGLNLTIALCDASFTYLLLLGGYRIIERFLGWLSGRQLAAWWDSLQGDGGGWLAWITDYLWGFIWDTFSQPLIWLVLASLVAGSRLGSIEDIIQRAYALAGRSDHQPGLVQRSLVWLVSQLFGDFNDKALPFFQGLKRLFKPGLVFVFSYAALFTGLDWLGRLLLLGIKSLIGPGEASWWAKLLPFPDLIAQVASFSLQLALLAVALVRADELIAKRQAPLAEDPVPPVVAAEPDATVVPASNRIWPALGRIGLPALLCALLTVGAGNFVVDTSYRTLSGQVGRPVNFLTMTVLVGTPSAGDSLVDAYGHRAQAYDRFVVIPLSASRQRYGEDIRPELVAGERIYCPWDGDFVRLQTYPGFRTSQDFVFEVAAADLAGPLKLRLNAGATFQIYVEILEIPVAFDAATIDASAETELEPRTALLKEVP